MSHRSLANLLLLLFFASGFGCALPNGQPHEDGLASPAPLGEIDSPALLPPREAIAQIAYEEPDLAEESNLTDFVAEPPVEAIEAFGSHSDATYGEEPLAVLDATDVLGQGDMTLSELEQLALANNPSIKQVSAAATKAAGIRTQVGLKPNPRIGYFADEIGDNGAAGLHGLFVSQTFVTGGKLKWNQSVHGHDVQSMSWQVEAQRFRVLTDLRQAFYRVLAAQRRIQVASEFRDTVEKGVRVTQALLDAEEGTRPDVLQSEVQLTEVDLVIQQAEIAYRAAWQELVTLVGVPDLAATTLIGNLEIDTPHLEIESAYRQLVTTSPLLKAAQAQVCRTKANLQRQKQQSHPNVSAQFGVGYDEATSDPFTNIQLSIPWTVHNQNQGNIRAAYAEYCEATQNVERLKLMFRRDLARVMRTYDSAAASVSRYEEAILPKVAQTQELIAQAYVAGEADYLRVLTTRKMYFEANLNYISALERLASSSVEIDGQLLSGGLTSVRSYDGDDGLRGQSLSQQ